MKKNLIKIFYHLFSFLSDRTNGSKLFVKYKLLLGTLLIGLTTTSCTNSPFRTTCYDPVAPEDTIPVTCYDLIVPVDTTIVDFTESDSPINNSDKNETTETL